MAVALEAAAPRDRPRPDSSPELFAVAAPCLAGPGRDGPLAGLTYAAKDLFRTQDREPSCGLSAGRVTVAAGPPLALDRLDAAGARRVAYAEMTELAHEPSGFSASRPRPVNPWYPGFATGGSSSGSAVLVAAGRVDFALGSDTGGSVRIPAACCGVTGLKPTFGSVPVQGAMALAPSLDTIGLLARDAGMLARVWPLLGDVAVDRAAVWETLRVVVLQDLMSEADPAILAACHAAIVVLRDAGLAIIEGEGGAAVAEADRHALVVMGAEAARTHQASLDGGTLDPVLARRLGRGLRTSDAELAASLALRHDLAQTFLSDVMAGADLALLPTLPGLVPGVSETDPRRPEFSARTLYGLSRFTRFVNLLGLPALSLPVGFDERGLPIGMQLVGHRGDERRLIDAAAAYQGRTDWHRRSPGLDAGKPRL